MHSERSQSQEPASFLEELESLRLDGFVAVGMSMWATYNEGTV